MGRTLPTARLLLQRLMSEWGAFAEVCTREEQDMIAWLWQSAERHASAIGHQAPPDPFHAIHLAMEMELLREIRRLQARVERLEEARPDFSNDVIRDRVP
jgi:hypothetical protein